MDTSHTKRKKTGYRQLFDFRPALSRTSTHNYEIVQNTKDSLKIKLRACCQGGESSKPGIPADGKYEQGGSSAVKSATSPTFNLFREKSPKYGSNDDISPKKSCSILSKTHVNSFSIPPVPSRNVQILKSKPESFSQSYGPRTGQICKVLPMQRTQVSGEKRKEESTNEQLYGKKRLRHLMLQSTRTGKSLCHCEAIPPTTEKKSEVLPSASPITTTKQIPKPKSNTVAVKEMLFQHHLYSSTEKPVFKSYPDVLQLSESYQSLLNVYTTLQGQRHRALKDLDSLENMKEAVRQNPFRFIRDLGRGDLVFPNRQKVKCIPNVELKYNGNAINLDTFNSKLSDSNGSLS